MGDKLTNMGDIVTEMQLLKESIIRVRSIIESILLLDGANSIQMNHILQAMEARFVVV